VKAVIIFVDVRGFTAWSESINVFHELDRFVTHFYTLIAQSFPSDSGKPYIKPLGDGAMIVFPFEDNTQVTTFNAKLSEILKAIRKVERDFSALCDQFAGTSGKRTPLLLGWGITRGPVREIPKGDYIGAAVNTAARLCDAARPAGIVIEADNFRKLPRNEKAHFFSEKRKLSGVNEPVNVWVTDSIHTQFVPREKLRHAPEVHVAGLCVREERSTLKALLARRAPYRKLYPGKWEGCGGQLAWSESFYAGVKRHFELELHLKVNVLEDFHTLYLIEEADEPLIPGVRFLCTYVGGEPQLLNHTEVKWVSEQEMKLMPETEFIRDSRSQFLELISRYKASRKKRRSSSS
jgi:class 3 adenylate cyclase